MNESLAFRHGNVEGLMAEVLVRPCEQRRVRVILSCSAGVYFGDPAKDGGTTFVPWVDVLSVEDQAPSPVTALGPGNIED